VVKDILARIEALRRFPKIGSPRDHVRRGLRAVIMHDYVAYYMLIRGEIVVVAVVYGSRDVEAFLAGDDSHGDMPG
jgi:plasmid stabilization system protein ParE